MRHYAATRVSNTNDTVVCVTTAARQLVGGSHDPLIVLTEMEVTAPDGVIDLSNDILGVIQQYLHDCR